MYGIWNNMRKEFQFGICEPTPEEAKKALFKKIRYDAYKWRFEVKRLPDREVTISSCGIAFCPTCKGFLWQNKDESNYCFRCGQKLYWD